MIDNTLNIKDVIDQKNYQCLAVQITLSVDHHFGLNGIAVKSSVGRLKAGW